MSTHNICALIYGNQKHYLDHLAPLASYLSVPLIVTEIEIESLATKYYPDLDVVYLEPTSMPQKVVSSFETVISCLPKALFKSIFFITEALSQKELKNVWCPHGNSDKGHFSPFMEGLSDEKWAFVYGKKMVSFLKEKSAHNQLENLFYLGNYRYEYFKKHREFYQKILNETLLFQNNHQTLLYAPTWNDSESSSSFDLEVNSLIDSLPPHWNLIIKPHPHLKCEIDNYKENLIVLKDFPPIYPLLDKMDVYLGDMSSIGYDFLTFRRPLFFYPPKNRTLNYDTHSHLMQCGTILPPSKNPFPIIEQTDQTPFSKIQDLVYNSVFETTQTIKKIYELR
jgi:hypothetical protein